MSKYGVRIVYVKKIDQCFFKKGWREFVEDIFVGSEDFLVFHYVGISKIEVIIHGKHCCTEKELLEAPANSPPIILSSKLSCSQLTCKLDFW